ncbi:MAG: hypothetical protein HND54_03170 [Bacteroidetes bacterium]|nr:hypothetical protein [Bacteroidota bacterium]
MRKDKKTTPKRILKILGTNYNFHWFIVAICISPLLYLTSVNNGTFNLNRVLFLSVFNIALLLVALLFTRKYKFYIDHCEQTSFLVSKKYPIKIVYYKDIQKIEFVPSIKGNSSLIIYYHANDKLFKRSIQMNKTKAHLLADYLKSKGLQQIKLINLSS